MKTFRWTALVVIVMVLVVGFGFMAWSGPQLKQTEKEAAKPSSPKVPGLISCPSGWHKKTGTPSDMFRCVPNEPTMSCPDGWVNYFDGCEVGCNKVPDAPR